MKLERLMELSGQDKLLKELTTDIEVEYKKDDINSLKSKLKKAGVNINGMSDYEILKFVNETKKITIESLKSKKILKEYQGMDLDDMMEQCSDYIFSEELEELAEDKNSKKELENLKTAFSIFEKTID